MSEEQELSAADERFCFEFVYSGNATRSYMKAHPNVKYNSAATEAGKLRKLPEIKKRIKELEAARKKKLQRSADKVLDRLEARASVNPRDAYDDSGKLKPLHELDPDLTLAIKSVTTRRVVEGKGEDAEVVEITKVEFYDGRASDELLGKNMQLWNDVGSKNNPLHANVGIQVVFGEDDDEEATPGS